MKKKKQDIFMLELEQIIANKSPSLLKRIPKFIIRFLKHVIHQDDMNKLLIDNKDHIGVRLNDEMLKDLNIKSRFHNSSVLKKDSRYLFVSNHPLGGVDGMVLASFLGNYFKEIKLVVNDILMNIKPFQSIYVPVNKFGKMKHGSVSLINDAYNSDAQIIYFPAGICSRLVKGKIVDLEWKKTFLTKAIEHNREIVPIYFDGRNSNFFYRLANLRKFLGIKINLELIFLPGEVFKQKNATFDVYIGNPIPINSITSNYTTKEWVNIIREHCYNLKPTSCNQSSSQ